MCLRHAACLPATQVVDNGTGFCKAGFAGMCRVYVACWSATMPRSSASQRLLQCLTWPFSRAPLHRRHVPSVVPMHGGPPTARSRQQLLSGRARSQGRPLCRHRPASWTAYGGLLQLTCTAAMHALQLTCTTAMHAVVPSKTAVYAPSAGRVCGCRGGGSQAAAGHHLPHKVHRIALQLDAVYSFPLPHPLEPHLPPVTAAPPCACHAAATAWWRTGRTWD